VSARGRRAGPTDDAAGPGGGAGPSRRITLEWDDRGGVTVHMDGSPQSHVQPQDPTVLVFEYVQHLALVLDALVPEPPAPLAVTHVGGAGLTLPRYVEATRPGSPQIVLEPDAELTALVREQVPLPRRHRIRVRPVDGLTGVAGLRDASAAVLVTDAYAAGRVPGELVGSAYATHVARVLGTGGVALWNLADEPGLRWVSRVVATARQVLPHVALLATHEVLKRRRFGNVVLVASGSPLPVERLRRDVARAPLPTGLRAGVELDRLCAGAKPFGDKGIGSPEPPDATGWRVV
jgi:spermidine synthase